jgi:hypothetical protein
MEAVGTERVAEKFPPDEVGAEAARWLAPLAIGCLDAVTEGAGHDDGIWHRAEMRDEFAPGRPLGASPLASYQGLEAVQS